MSATKVSPTGTGTTTPRSGRSVLDVVMLVGLFLVVVAGGVAQALEGAIIPPVVVFQALYLLCGIVVAIRWRWAMLLPLVICPLGIVADFASGFPEYTLTHPGSNAVAFDLFVLEYPLLALVIGGSASKLVQTLRREPFHAPRGLSPAVGAVAGLILGAFLSSWTTVRFPIPSPMGPGAQTIGPCQAWSRERPWSTTSRSTTPPPRLARSPRQAP